MSPTFRVYTPACSTKLCFEVCAFVFAKGLPFRQVLCQTNDQCEQVNRGIQQLMPASPELKIQNEKGVTLFVIRQRDPVICVQNVYVNDSNSQSQILQHANGDTATIVGWTQRFNEKEKKEELMVTVYWGNANADVNVDNPTTYWSLDDFASSFKLAYAITIHKSQGSEYDAGVVVLSPKCRWFAQRSLLYTAITRFKSECTIFALDADLDATVKAPIHLYVMGNMTNRLQTAVAI